MSGYEWHTKNSAMWATSAGLLKRSSGSFFQTLTSGLQTPLFTQHQKNAGLYDADSDAFRTYIVLALLFGNALSRGLEKPCRVNTNEAKWWA